MYFSQTHSQWGTSVEKNKPLGLEDFLESSATTLIEAQKNHESKVFSIIVTWRKLEKASTPPRADLQTKVNDVGKSIFMWRNDVTKNPMIPLAKLQGFSVQRQWQWSSAHHQSQLYGRVKTEVILQEETPGQSTWELQNYSLLLLTRACKYASCLKETR